MPPHADLAAAMAGTATFWAMPGLTVLGAVMLCSGPALSPVLISGLSSPFPSTATYPPVHADIK
jgi:hypothetical protein